MKTTLSLLALTALGILAATVEAWPQEVMRRATPSTLQAAANDLVFLISAPGNCLFQFTDTVGLPSQNLAALWIRAVFHDAGTYSAADQSGGADGSLVNELNLPENGGLGGSLGTRFVPHGNQSGALPISEADIIALGGVVTVQHCGGPQIPFRQGRVDVAPGIQNNASRLPAANVTLDDAKQIFAAMNLSNLDMMVLTAGSHTMGGAHAAISPTVTNQTFAPFDSTPGVFDNDIFKRILANNCVLPIDCAFGKDPELLPFIQLYATNQTAFFQQYVISFTKMMELTSSPLGDPTYVSVPVQGNLVAEGTYPKVNTTSSSTSSAVVTTTTTSSSTNNSNNTSKSNNSPPSTFKKSSILGWLTTTIFVMMAVIWW